MRHMIQASTKIESGDTVDDLARNIHKLEYEHFPRVIEGLLKEN